MTSVSSLFSKKINLKNMIQQKALSYRELQQFLYDYKEIGVTDVRLNDRKEVLQAEYERLVAEAEAKEIKLATMSNLTSEEVELYTEVVNYLLHYGYGYDNSFEYIIGFTPLWVHGYILWEIRYLNQEGDVELIQISDSQLYYYEKQVSEVCDPEMHIQEAIFNLRRKVPVNVIMRDGKYTIYFQWTGIVCYAKGNKIVVESHIRLENHEIVDDTFYGYIYCGVDKFKEFSKELNQIFYMYEFWEVA